MLKEGEAPQPATMMFRFGPIDRARFDTLPKNEVAALASRGYENGDLARAALHSSRDPFSSDAWFNISRLGVDATDAFALGAAEIEGRRQAWRRPPSSDAKCPAAQAAACAHSQPGSACARPATSRATRS